MHMVEARARLLELARVRVKNHCKALPPISTAGAALFLAGGM